MGPAASPRPDVERSRTAAASLMIAIAPSMRRCAPAPPCPPSDTDASSSTRNALAKGSSARFRLLHFSVQADHLHLLVEADGPTGFERGVRGLAIRVARAVNRALGRHGRVWGDRYHARLLRTPREVRNALVYVLNNFRKHIRGARGLDPRSSARWFDGWLGGPGRVVGGSPVAVARTWIARVGWRRRGLIDVVESPSPRRMG